MNMLWNMKTGMISGRVLPVVKDAQKFANEILNEKINFVMSKLKCASDEDKELVKISIKKQ